MSNDSWSTPPGLFNWLNATFGPFTVDVAAEPGNTKVQKYYTYYSDGLKQDWSDENVWCNPPYGRGIGKWVEKAYKSVSKETTVTMLLPSTTSAKWWPLVMQGHVIFLPGRVSFTLDGKEYCPSPFPCTVVNFRFGRRGLVQKFQCSL
jgi:phage N-6-adenine-methyltransferase